MLKNRHFLNIRNKNYCWILDELSSNNNEYVKETLFNNLCSIYFKSGKSTFLPTYYIFF